MLDVFTRLELFCKLLGEQAIREYDRLGYSKVGMIPPTYTLEPGQKLVRVVTNNHPGRSVYCFVDKANGDIYKASGWKAPAKHVRGNIFNDNCEVGTKCDMHGGGLYIR